MDLWTSPTDRREPCGPCGQPVDNADALPTACPHSRASRPQAPQDQSPVILTRQHRTTLRRGCLHRPFRTTSASHSNPSQHRPRPSSPPILQAHFRMGLDFSAACTPEDRWFLAASGGRRSPLSVRRSVMWSDARLRHGNRASNMRVSAAIALQSVVSVFVDPPSVPMDDDGAPPAARRLDPALHPCSSKPSSRPRASPAPSTRPRDGPTPGPPGDAGATTGTPGARNRERTSGCDPCARTGSEL